MKNDTNTKGNENQSQRTEHLRSEREGIKHEDR